MARRRCCSCNDCRRWLSSWYRQYPISFLPVQKSSALLLCGNKEAKAMPATLQNGFAAPVRRLALPACLFYQAARSHQRSHGGERARTILTSEKVARQLSLTLQLLQLLSGLLGFGAIGIFLLHLLQKSGRCARLLTRQRHIPVSGEAGTLLSSGYFRSPSKATIAASNCFWAYSESPIQYCALLPKAPWDTGAETV